MKIKQITHESDFKCKKVNFVAWLLNEMHTIHNFIFGFKIDYVGRFSQQNLDTANLRSDLP